MQVTHSNKDSRIKKDVKNLFKKLLMPIVKGIKRLHDINIID